jgi:hypothetical protein
VAFTKEQPKHGDTILHCGHLDRSADHHHPAHWFQFAEPKRFIRPDQSRGEAQWFAACEPCYLKHGEKVTKFVRGDGVWTGDAPAIEKDEN